MDPRDEPHTPQDGLFRSELVNLIDPRHPLVKLTDRIDWIGGRARVERVLPAGWIAAA